MAYVCGLAHRFFKVNKLTYCPQYLGVFLGGRGVWVETVRIHTESDR